MGSENANSEVTTGTPVVPPEKVEKMVPLTALQKERQQRQAAEALVRELTEKNGTTQSTRASVEEAMVDPDKLSNLIAERAGHLVDQREQVRAVQTMMGEFAIFNGELGADWAEDAVAAVMVGLERLPATATLDEVKTLIEATAKRFETRLAATTEPKGTGRGQPPVSSGSAASALSAAHMKDFKTPTSLKEAANATSVIAKAFAKARGMFVRDDE